jgi:GTPase SAR1 family protein
MALNRMYIRDAHAAIVTYDVTKEESLVTAEKWIEEVKEAGPTQMIMVMAGNKMET